VAELFERFTHQSNKAWLQNPIVSFVRAEWDRRMKDNNAAINSIDIDGTVGRVRWNACLVVLTLLAFATWRRYSNWPAIFDIGLWDETSYLGGELSRTYHNYEGGPLYEAYYYAVSLLVHDPVDLYFIGGLAIQLAALCSIAFVAWMLSRSLAITTATFGLILCSPFLLAWPRVSYLAVVLVTFGSWLASLEAHISNRLAVTTLVSLVICYVRPEFMLTFYLAGFALLGVLIGWTLPAAYRAGWGETQVASHNRLAAYLSALLCLAALLHLAWSFPVPRGGGRAMGAFVQHYAMRWMEEHGSSFDFDYKLIVDKVFPGATTPFQALLSNPTAWLQFTVHNVLGSARSMRVLLLVRENILIAVGLFGLMSVAAWSMHRRMRGAGLLSRLKAILLIEWGLYAIAPLCAMVLVYPREHYTVILLATLMIGCVAVGRWHSWSKVSDSTIALVGALVIAVQAWPLPVVDQPTLKSVMALRNLNLPLRSMLEVDGGWCTYLKSPCTPVYPLFVYPHSSRSTTPMLQTIRQEGVDSIIVSTWLINLLQARHDQSLDGIIQKDSPEWRRYEIGDSRYLLYREKARRVAD
jgi:hypothetical protein